MPFLVTSLTKVRLRPAISFISKQRPRCPMMILRTFGITNLAKVWRDFRVKNFWLYSAILHNLSFYKVLSSMPTVKTNKRIFWSTTSVSVKPNKPAFRLFAFRAFIIRIVYFIFPRGASHEAMPVL